METRSKSKMNRGYGNMELSSQKSKNSGAEGNNNGNIELSSQKSKNSEEEGNNNGNMERSSQKSKNSRGEGNKANTRSEFMSESSSTRRLLLEVKLKEEKSLKEIIERELEVEMQRKKIELEKRIIRTRYELERVKIADEDCRATSLQVEEDLILQEDNLLATEKVKNWLTDNKCQNKEDNITINNFDLKQLLMRQSMEKDLPIFHGEIKEWQYFYKQFETTTHMLGLSDEENLCRLRKCLQGEAKRSVEGLLITSVSVDSIIQILKRKYGRPELIVRSLINEARSLAYVKSHDFKGLILFSETVCNLVVTLESLNMKNYIQCPQLMEDLLLKLPYNMQLAWGEKVSRSDVDCNLTEFKEWIWKKAEAASYVPMTMKHNNSNAGMDVSKARNGTKEKHKFTTLLTTNQDCTFCNQGNHTLEDCKSFQNVDVKGRWEFIKQKGMCYCCLRKYHRISECRRKKACGIDGCVKLHHSMLHNKDLSTTETNNKELVRIVAHTDDRTRKQEILLKIAAVCIWNGNTEYKTFALFDEASTISIIDENVARKLDMQGDETQIALKWTDKSTFKNITSRKVSFNISGQDNKVYAMNDVYTMKDLDLPAQSINKKAIRSEWIELYDIKIENLQNAKPEILIGQDNWELITSRQVIEGFKNSPALSLTKLGWVVHGRINNLKGRINESVVLHVRHKNYDDEELHEEVKQYFAIESFGVKLMTNKYLSKDDEKAVKLAEENTVFEGDRWKTGLLWKDQSLVLEEDQSVAMQRWKYIEKRLNKDENFAKLYGVKIEEYVKKGYARKLTEEELTVTHKKMWFLPHFGVVNENKPGKIRFVFDAAAKIGNCSLNDYLFKGPDLYNSLIGIIWKFRQNRIAFAGDIREMFHQIRIHNEDQHAQRFLWKNKGDREFDIYVMQVMIFGAISSPFSAQYVKNRNALQFSDEYPQAVNAIIYKHYMDDYLDSVHTDEEAIKLINDVIHVHKKGGFDMRNWISNSETLLKNINGPEGNIGKEVELTSSRVLGLKWNTKDDTLGIMLSFNKVENDLIQGNRKPTKREVLKVVMSLYDPLGFFGFFTIRGKIILQEIWKSEIHWEDKIPDSIFKKWKKWIKYFDHLKEISIPRCYSINYNTISFIDLHIFCDASEQAFATIGYFRYEKDGIVEIAMVMSKNQVSPIKPLTIPRLELQAAVMGSRLAKTIKYEHSVSVRNTYFWTDSTIVLNWIKSESRNFKTFVSNRIAEIHENSEEDQWNWISTKFNVADKATRDYEELNIKKDSDWFKGPEFLYLNEKYWPKRKDIIADENLMEYKKDKIVLLIQVRDINYLPDIARFSKWRRLINATAYLWRYLNNLKYKIGKTDTCVKENCLTVEELREAEKLWCQKVQVDSFSGEIKMLLNKKTVDKTSRLYQLSPLYMDDLIRVNGRTNNSSTLNEETKMPIILDNKHRYTKLLINYYHTKYAHQGKETILNELRLKYWILQSRKAVDNAFKNCNVCKIRLAKPIIPEMGELPQFRINKPEKIFSHVGVDYFGPMEVVLGRRKEKRYGVLFTCLSVRAIHIEIADSLNTDSVILALRRFMGRRGEVKCMYSDNGTNFTSAAKELKKCIQELNQEEITKELYNRQTEWKFIPPASPHFGGAWERLVRSVKQALKNMIKEKVPRYEVLQF